MYLYILFIYIYIIYLYLNICFHFKISSLSTSHSVARSSMPNMIAISICFDWNQGLARYTHIKLPAQRNRDVCIPQQRIQSLFICCVHAACYVFFVPWNVRDLRMFHCRNTTSGPCTAKHFSIDGAMGNRTAYDERNNARGKPSRVTQLIATGFWWSDFEGQLKFTRKATTKFGKPCSRAGDLVLRTARHQFPITFMSEPFQHIMPHRHFNGNASLQLL